jgi:hypothetical protein
MPKRIDAFYAGKTLSLTTLCTIKSMTSKITKARAIRISNELYEKILNRAIRTKKTFNEVVASSLNHDFLRKR